MTICIKLIKHKIMKKKELMLLPVMLLSMANVFAQEVGTLQLKDVNGDGYINYVRGANVAGFMKVAKAMMAQGIV